jgi:hypothetical protein
VLQVSSSRCSSDRCSSSGIAKSFGSGRD